MGRKSSVVVHTPRNVDLPPHVVMIRGSEDEALYISSENGEQKPPVSYPRKRCFCLCAWLFGLILLCIGVFVIVHYLLVDNGENLNGKQISSIVTDKQFSILFRNFDVSKVCNDSLESSLTLEKKVTLSDYVVVGNVVLQPDMKRSINNANYGSINPANPFIVTVDTSSSPLKGSLSEISRYDEQNKQLVLDIGYDNECRSSYAIAASSGQPQILFFISDSRLYGSNNNIKGSHNIIPLFHPLSSSAKLVHIIRRIAKEDVTRQAGRKNQSPLDRLEFDVPTEVIHDLSSTPPDVSAVKLKGVESGRNFSYT